MKLAVSMQSLRRKCNVLHHGSVFLKLVNPDRPDELHYLTPSPYTCRSPQHVIISRAVFSRVQNIVTLVSHDADDEAQFAAAVSSTRRLKASKKEKQLINTRTPYFQVWKFSAAVRRLSLSNTMMPSLDAVETLNLFFFS